MVRVRTVRYTHAPAADETLRGTYIGRPARLVHPPTCLGMRPIRLGARATAHPEPADQEINHSGSMPRCSADTQP
ncbi:hypothetical protein PGT21_018641 [Puccinia graminis f. sp. tritici]|uniref:Uncharacterized protein n=1 Tax=Puccinia graminis f. sp. tritici TaxID=56615 RepID=A0A5B0M3B6_PUCGR|nr:hypothetical protein PGT21_023626 [Puccinia graminis f. sp. tritici]KAA1103463.1 hypothetical protein PGT21_018641 [Puccinia graminis f. sp. tritici]